MESRAKTISNWQVGGCNWRSLWRRRDNRPAISGFHPTEHEKHSREQRSAIAVELIFGYLNYRPSNIVVMHSTEGGRFSPKYQGGGGQMLKRSEISINKYTVICKSARRL